MLAAYSRPTIPPIPILLSKSFVWITVAAGLLLSSLVGYLIYPPVYSWCSGGVTQADRLVRAMPREQRRQRPVETIAPAM